MKRLLKPLKAMFGVGVMGLGAWVILEPLLFPGSLRAVVAGSLIAVNAPIDGVLTGESLRVGEMVAQGQHVAALENPWADGSKSKDLQTRFRAADAELAALAPLTEDLDKFALGLKEGVGVYQSRRILQLRARAGELDARLEADRARSLEAEARFRREQGLAREGLAAMQSLAGAERDASVAKQSVFESQSALVGVKLQLDAAERGVIVDAQGMGADRPYSRQRLDEVTLEKARFRQARASREQVRDALRGELDTARAAFEAARHVELSAPERARVWQVFAGRGAFLKSGARVATLLQCDSALVVATVSERVARGLSVGSRARFKQGFSGQSMAGRVVQLLGSGDRQPDALVAPGVLDNMSELGVHRVVLSFPDLPKSNAADCAVGQSGDVSFE